MTEREKFEAWAVKQRQILMFISKGTGGAYIDADAKIAWIAWQAAIESTRQKGEQNEQR